MCSNSLTARNRGCFHKTHTELSYLSDLLAVCIRLRSCIWRDGLALRKNHGKHDSIVTECIATRSRSKRGALVAIRTNNGYRTHGAGKSADFEIACFLTTSRYSETDKCITSHFASISSCWFHVLLYSAVDTQIMTTEPGILQKLSAPTNQIKKDGLRPNQSDHIA